MDHNKITWKTEIRLVEDLLPNVNNPRRISKAMAEKLKESLNKFGVCSPIQINTDGKIIGGHQRAKVLQQLGIKEVEVKIPDRELSKDESDQLNLMLNKVHGEFDDEILANCFDLDLVLDSGFSEKDLQVDQISSEGGEEGEEKKSKHCTMLIKFKEPEHLQEAENAIAMIVDCYPGATHKVKL